jgi:peptide/nickel transport system substrate-binding protein
MKHRDLELLLRDLRTGRLNRRQAITRLAVLGIGASGISAVLRAATPQVARAAAAAPGRGTQGTLKLLYWQAPTILNPHLSQGVKDFHAARMCVEPLLTVDGAGNFSPVLAAEVPSLANGGVAKDGKSVTYKLKPGVKWADGREFTSDDVAFTFQFVQNKQTAATTYGSYVNVAKVEPLNPLTVKITFKSVTPAWYLPFVGSEGGILPRHALDAYIGNNARNAPFNLKAFGTGPYMVDTFRPGDLVTYVINPNYREPNKPAFSSVQMKGGGDAPSAARAVFETTEYDYAWNLQVEWPVLQQMIAQGKGQLLVGNGGGVETLYFNQTDPNKMVDGERSSLKAPHPFLTDPKVRQALGIAVDRQTMAQQLYGQEGSASANLLTTPTSLLSKNNKLTYDVAAANKLLDEAGWQRGPDGTRQKGGVKMQVIYQTTINSLRQKEQEIVKAGWTQIGVATTLKSIDAGVFFSSSPGNNDTAAHFYTDVEMFTDTFGSPFPSAYMAQWYAKDPGTQVAQKANNWAGIDYVRWVDKQYNDMYDQVLVELDPEKSRAIWIQMNDRVIEQAASWPLIDRHSVSAHVNTLDVGQNMSPFDSETRNVADWTRKG